MSDLVKALEWHNFDAWTWWAESVCGTYHVEERNGGWRVELRFHDARHVVTEADDFDAAIATAQADYTARILAALDLTAIEAMEAENKRLREALAFYADPQVYAPHPHGIAFDRRDLSFVARAALARLTEKDAAP